MLIPYEALTQLPADTLNNLIKEYLLGQVEDGSFDALSGEALTAAIARVKSALQQGELMVEYAEDDESIAIRSREQLTQSGMFHPHDD